MKRVLGEKEGITYVGWGGRSGRRKEINRSSYCAIAALS